MQDVGLMAVRRGAYLERRLAMVHDPLVSAAGLRRGKMGLLRDNGDDKSDKAHKGQRRMRQRRVVARR